MNDTISTVTSVALDTNINDTLSSSNQEHDSDSDKAALLSLRRDLTHSGTRQPERDPSIWYSVKSFGPAGKLSIETDESFSSDSDDESNSDADFGTPIKKSVKPMSRTPKRKHKALYKSTREHSSWTKKYDEGKNIMKKTRDKHNHTQKKKHVGRQNLNMKSATTENSIWNKILGAVGLYTDNVRQILYNKTHYSPYLNQLPGHIDSIDISFLWSKKHSVKPFDESFRVPLPSNRVREETSMLGGKDMVENKHISYLKEKKQPHNIHFIKKDKADHDATDANLHKKTVLSKLGDIPHKGKVEKKYISVLRENKRERENKPRNAAYVKKDKADHDDTDVNFHKRTVDESKHLNVYDFINFYLNTHQLPKVNVKPRTGNWLEHLKNISKLVINGGENVWQEHLKPKLNDTITVKPLEFLVTINPVEMYHTMKDKVVSVAEEAENLWQKEVKPNFVDKIKDVFVPGGSQDTTVPVPTVTVNETILQTIVNGTAGLWQPWVHRVRDDVKINSFINTILRHNQNIFDVIEKKCKDKNWKIYVRYLAKAYEDKFSEFIRDTSEHKIKSRMGTERVVLNSISVSNRILTRIVNLAMDEIDNNGNLVKNIDITKLMIEKFNQEAHSILERACSNLNVCRHKNGVMDFVGDIFTKISSLDGKKFEIATSALTAAVRNTDLTESLGADVTKGLHKQASKFDKFPYAIKVGAFSVMKNIVVNRNTPLVVYGDGKVGATHKTIAMLDVFKTLDEKVPASQENVKQWNNIKADMKSYVENRSQNINSTMIAFVKQVKKAIDGTNKLAKIKIRNSSLIFLS